MIFASVVVAVARTTRVDLPGPKPRAQPASLGAGRAANAFTARYAELGITGRGQLQS
jgi:hypothetical protein